MKIIQVSYSDISGGAAIAAFRLNNALNKHGIDSTMLVNHAASSNRLVTMPLTKVQRRLAIFKRFLSETITKVLLKTNSPFFHSPCLFTSSFCKIINDSDADIVHLHWICHEMISIKGIAKINKPIVWTLHDMWAFCGAEHYTTDERWKIGYTRGNRPQGESRIDLNRWVWMRKKNAYIKKMTIIAPSRWLGTCVSESKLMSGWPISIIPNTIDTDIWKPIEKHIAKKILNISTTFQIITFGATGGGKYSYKGIDLLFEAIIKLNTIYASKIELCIFGQDEPEVKPKLGVELNYMGKLHDEISLRLVYAISDVFIIPSRMDNLPNTGLEALASGIPVVAFNAGGLGDIIIDKYNGRLITPFDSSEMGEAIKWILEDKNRYLQISEQARTSAINRFSNETVVEAHKHVYESIFRKDN